MVIFIQKKLLQGQSHETRGDKNSQEAALNTVTADKFDVKDEPVIERSEGEDVDTKDDADGDELEEFAQNDDRTIILITGKYTILTKTIESDDSFLK